MKNELRRFYKILRKKLDPKDKKIWDKIIGRKVLENPYYKNCDTLFIYFSKNDENDTKNIIKKALADKKEVYIPKIFEKNTIKPVLLESFDDLIMGEYGIFTSKNKKTSLNPDLVIVPGLSYDSNLYRLGFGGGYYDKFIKDHKSSTFMGLFYDNSESFDLNIDKFDKSLDIIITEKKILKKS